MIRISFSFLYFIASIFSFGSTCAQNQLKRIGQIKTKELEQLMVDRLGNFFTVTSGEIRKHDPNGKVIAKAKTRGTHISLLEPWYHPTIFTYDHKKQTITTFDRLFENRRTQSVEPSLAVEPYLICPKSDNRVLILDGGDYSIKVVNLLTNTVQSEFMLEATITQSNPKFTYMREYQNMIFLLDPEVGIIVLNNVGRLITTIEASQLQNFNFFGEEIYYLKNQQLEFWDLYTEEIRTIPLDANAKFVLTTDERIIVGTRQKTIQLYELPSFLLDQK